MKKYGIKIDGEAITDIRNITNWYDAQNSGQSQERVQ